jgi:hypothetical protein
MNSWQHDIEPAVREMEEKLSALGVAKALSRAPIEAVFERYADGDDWIARRHFYAAIAKEANEVLASQA